VRFVLDPSWSLFPAAEGEAIGVACDSSDRVFVLTRGPLPVHVFDCHGKRLGTWGEGQFKRPHGIAIDRVNRVWCTDDYGHVVRIFSPEGDSIRTLGIPGQPSDTGATTVDYRTIRRASGPFCFPTNVAFDAEGEIFVADGYGNARIHRFDPEGNLRSSWGEPGAGPGQFHVPHGIAVDAAGDIHVADRENSRIQRFTRDGRFVSEQTDVARPCEIAFDAAGFAYVAELGFRAGRWPGTGEAEPGQTGGRVSVFDPVGNLTARWGGGDNPCAPGDFYAPHDLCIDSHGDVYVAEVAWSAGGAVGRIPGHCRTLQKFVRT
jgi:DNA-binding beta-propeller fold protein YncE